MFAEADRDLVEGLSAFCAETLAPQAAALDEGSVFATTHRAALADIGIMGLNLPEEYGGVGADPFTLFEGVALVAGACGSTASLVTAHYLATDSIAYGGDAAQKAKWLPDAAAGRTLGAFALTEPGAGSNPADMTTIATREGDVWRIRGTKHFISNAGAADFIVAYVKTDPAAGARGISAFIVDAKAGGVSVGAAERTMGLRGGHVFEVAFDCLVPQENMLGQPGGGFRLALKVLDSGRLDVAAMCVGMAEAAFGQARDWMKTREVGGAPIAEFQGLQWMLADMATDIAASRGLGHAASVKRAKGERFSLEASMAKLHASEMAARVTDKALQIHGGYGFTRALPLERYVRDVRIMRIYEGSSEIQRNIIARTLLA